MELGNLSSHFHMMLMKMAVPISFNILRLILWHPLSFCLFVFSNLAAADHSFQLILYITFFYAVSFWPSVRFYVPRVVGYFTKYLFNTGFQYFTYGFRDSSDVRKRLFYLAVLYTYLSRTGFVLLSSSSEMSLCGLLFSSNLFSL